MKAHGSSDKGPDIESKQQNVCKQHDILVKFTVDRAILNVPWSNPANRSHHHVA